MREENIHRISNCIEKIKMSNLTKEEEMIEKLRQYCEEKDFKETLQCYNENLKDNSRNNNKKEVKLNNPKTSDE